MLYLCITVMLYLKDKYKGGNFSVALFWDSVFYSEKGKVNNIDELKTEQEGKFKALHHPNVKVFPLL